MYRKFRLIVLSILYRFPSTRTWAYVRLPRHRSGYKRHWIDVVSKRHRDTLEERQGATLQRFFPTKRTLRRSIAAHRARTVLDIGCGYGRLLEEIAMHFDAQGCDVAQDLLDRVRPDLRDKVFQLDIVNPLPGWVEAHHHAWDVSYAWAVFMYFIDDEESMRAAMRHAEAVTKQKVLVWDWKHVCDYMQKIYPSDKFEYHNIPVTLA